MTKLIRRGYYNIVCEVTKIGLLKIEKKIFFDKLHIVAYINSAYCKKSETFWISRIKAYTVGTLIIIIKELKLQLFN